MTGFLNSGADRSDAVAHNSAAAVKINFIMRDTSMTTSRIANKLDSYGTTSRSVLARSEQRAGVVPTNSPSAWMGADGELVNSRTGARRN
jgi:hypothetical protein